MKIVPFFIALAVVVCSADDTTPAPKNSGGPTPAPVPAPEPDSDSRPETDSETEPNSSPPRPLILPRPPILPPVILPPVLPPPPNNCSAGCPKNYSPVCGGPIYGCGELIQQSNLCMFKYFNCVNLIKTGIPYEVKYNGPCYAPIIMP